MEPGEPVRKKRKPSALPAQLLFQREHMRVRMRCQFSRGINSCRRRGAHPGAGAEQAVVLAPCGVGARFGAVHFGGASPGARHRSRQRKRLRVRQLRAALRQRRQVERRGVESERGGRGVAAVGVCGVARRGDARQQPPRDLRLYATHVAEAAAACQRSLLVLLLLRDAGRANAAVA